jgi:hypothetical protein
VGYLQNYLKQNQNHKKLFESQLLKSLSYNHNITLTQQALPKNFPYPALNFISMHSQRVIFLLNNNL